MLEARLSKLVTDKSTNLLRSPIPDNPIHVTHIEADNL